MSSQNVLPATPFSTVLIANRGEIACRVIRTARAMGYRTVAVYSEADADAPHVRLADRAVPIGPAPAAASYLDVDAVLRAAALAGADAVHPGYGFLSENAAFAEACAAAGLVFIGPPAAAIRAMGNKAAAKERMLAAGVPCVPGYQGADQSDPALAGAAGRIGFPVMVKAAAGGGGRGMRLVTAAGALPAALSSARSEALNAFGSGELILEKAIVDARHVEVQVFADRHGNLVHLGERDCSVQRRHQKVIEESPSPAVAPALRARMGAAAVEAARAIAYEGAGTVEFLLDADGAFYFLEMNTRLQVEHPVTEAITGLDLVEWQLRVAAGEPLPLAQEAVRFDGHAIEVRLYAEDPYRDFLPCTGRLLAWRPAEGAGRRTDHGIRAGQEVSAFYDPMLAKLIAHGRDREEARRRLLAALDDTLLLGVVTNRSFLARLLRHPDFVAGAATTAFIEHRLGPIGAAPQPGRTMLALAAALFCGEADRGETGWSSTGTLAWTMRLAGDGGTGWTVSAAPAGGGRLDVAVDGEAVSVAILERNGTDVRFLADGVQRTARAAIEPGPDGDALHLDLDGVTARLRETLRDAAAGGERDAGGTVAAPMNGVVVDALAVDGDRVEKGQCLFILEAMKMQLPVNAPRAGRLERVAVRVGQQVRMRHVLAEIVLAEIADA